MDLHQLEYFVCVTEHRSFSRAAAALRISQPLLSRHVRQLEVELEETLLLRNGRGVTVTEAGQRMLEHARSLLDRAAQARREIKGLRGVPAGRITVGLPPGVARTLTPPLLTSFQARFPKATLAIVEAFSASMLEWLALGRLDVGVLYNAVPTAGVELRPWRHEPVFLIASASAVLGTPSVQMSRLSEYPLVVSRQPNAFRMLLETRMASIGSIPRIVLEIDGVTEVLDLVAKGHGFAVLPRTALALMSASNSLAAYPIEPSLDVAVSFGFSAYRQATPLRSATVALIEEIGASVNL